MCLALCVCKEVPSHPRRAEAIALSSPFDDSIDACVRYFNGFLQTIWFYLYKDLRI